MEDTPVAKRFDMLCNYFHPTAEIAAMSDDSCNALIEDLHSLKIKFSTNSSSDNNEEDGTEEAALSNENTTCKTILSPIAIRCARRPPSLRKESKVDKLIRQAQEKKKKEELREKKKAAQEEKKKASEKVFFFLNCVMFRSTNFSVTNCCILGSFRKSEKKRVHY
jgi:hypothetical protein